MPLRKIWNYDTQAIETIVYFAEGDVRKAINILQSSASIDEKITEESIYDVVSKARPKDVRKMVTTALNGDFMGARDTLREIMVFREPVAKIW